MRGRPPKKAYKEDDVKDVDAEDPLDVVENAPKTGKGRGRPKGSVKKAPAVAVKDKSKEETDEENTKADLSDESNDEENGDLAESSPAKRKRKTKPNTKYKEDSESEHDTDSFEEPDDDSEDDFDPKSSAKKKVPVKKKAGRGRPPAAGKKKAAGRGRPPKETKTGEVAKKKKASSPIRYEYDLDDSTSGGSEPDEGARSDDSDDWNYRPYGDIRVKKKRKVSQEYNSEDDGDNWRPGKAFPGSDKKYVKAKKVAAAGSTANDVKTPKKRGRPPKDAKGRGRPAKDGKDEEKGNLKEMNDDKENIDDENNDASESEEEVGEEE